MFLLRLYHVIPLTNDRIKFVVKKMAKSVTYFMWGFQPHFQLTAERSLESVLHTLDPSIESRLQLVGFLSEEKKERHPICVCPDDAPYQPEAFAHILPHAKYLGSYDPMKAGFHTHPIAQENMIHRIEREGFCSAIAHAINAKDGQIWNTFVRGPYPIEGYDVFVVAQVSISDSAHYYRLSKSKSAGCFTMEFEISRSLIEAAVNAALNDIGNSLSSRTPPQRVEREVANQIFVAGKRMMDAPALAGKTPDGIHGHFQLCNSISSLSYESSEGSGRMYYVARDHPSVDVEIKLRDEVSMRNVRAVRKMLETTSKEMSLLCDSTAIYGLGRIDSEYDDSREDVFTVNFIGRSTWELLHGEKCLMQVEFGVPKLKRQTFPHEVLRSMLHRVLEVDKEQANALVAIAKKVAKSPHGSMLVVSKSAKDEAIRLATQSTRIEPVQLSRYNAANLASIDGAILVGTDGVCHAFGVILDGVAHEKCTPSRGARYNSAIRYALNRDDCVVVIQSEDGMIDIVPHLRPQISKREIKLKIQAFKHLSEQEKPDTVEFNQTMRWLDERRFYMTKKNCKRIETYRKMIEPKLEPEAFQIVLPTFKRHPELNASYFFD